jgi:hypothetical protein
MDSLGLWLADDLDPGGYWCTPVNSVMFASTGGDGVHFSLIDVGSGFGERSPIVMTVPMSADPNWIVGEDLLDFLSLGLDGGYFVLGSFAYGADWDIEVRGSAGPSLLPLLEDLAERFGLRPWENVAERLRVLDRRYRDALVLGDLPADSPGE